MKAEHVKLGKEVVVNNPQSINHLKSGRIESLPLDDIHNYVKVVIDNVEYWIQPFYLDYKETV